MEETTSIERRILRWSKVHAGIAVLGLMLWVVSIAVVIRIDDKASKIQGEIADNTEAIRKSLLNIEGRGGVGEEDSMPAPEPAPTITPTIPGTQGEPEIIVIGGEYGPTDQNQVRGGVACNVNSLNCRYLHYELTDLSPGKYEIVCEHDGWGFYGPGTFGASHEVVIHEYGVLSRRADCFINFDRLTGLMGVRVVANVLELVSPDGSSITVGEQILSNWTKEVRQLPPR